MTRKSLRTASPANAVDERLDYEEEGNQRAVGFSYAHGISPQAPKQNLSPEAKRTDTVEISRAVSAAGAIAISRD